MQRTVHNRAIARMTPVWLFSVAIIIFAVQFNVAQAQNNPKKDRAAFALACRKQLEQQCSGVRVQANNMLECLQRTGPNLSIRCSALANNVVRLCDRDAAQRCQDVVVGGGNILGCLTAAKRRVSKGCNAAIDAAGLR